MTTEASKRANKKNMERYHSDPEYREKNIQNSIRWMKKRREKWREQGLNCYGKPYKPKKVPEPYVPTPSHWEQITGLTLEQWGEKFGASREGARQRFKKIENKLDDSDSIFQEMKRTGEWPADLKERLQAVKKPRKKYKKRMPPIGVTHQMVDGRFYKKGSAIWILEWGQRGIPYHETWADSEALIKKQALILKLKGYELYEPVPLTEDQSVAQTLTQPRRPRNHYTIRSIIRKDTI